jgi:DNA replication and repair protein RecF
MAFQTLRISNLRNITQLEIAPAEGINLIYGKNGSGKTSLLESIFMLGRGRSFRSSRAAPLICTGKKSLEIYGEYYANDTLNKIGIRKTLSDTEIHLNGENIHRLSELAVTVPLQILTPQSYQLLDRGPEYRRKFIEWGVFHVEHQYSELLKRFLRAMNQRNAALKSNQKIARAWDKEVADCGELINSKRERYFGQLKNLLENELKCFMPDLEFEIVWRRGWKIGMTLSDSLTQNFERDCERKFTGSGPQRADIEIRINKIPVSQYASRGQQKLLVAALCIAQLKLSRQLTDRKSVLLVDDLAAELDSYNREMLFSRFKESGSQVFLTSTDPQLLSGMVDSMFHVEHGSLA